MSVESDETEASSQPEIWSVRVGLPTEYPPEEIVPHVEWMFEAEGSDLYEEISRGWDRGIYELRYRGNYLGGPTEFVLRVTPRPNGSYVRIHESGFRSIELRDERLKLYERQLKRLNRLLIDASRLRRRTRQAVVVVHGIGEQLPGQTLRSFVDGVFGSDSGRFVKPDYTSSLFELRMMRIPPDPKVGIPATDVYELYWAHLIRDTKLGQVYGWMLRLLLAPNANIPAALRRHFWGVRVFIVVVATAVGCFLVARTGAPAHTPGPRTALITGASWIVATTTVLLAIAPAVGWAILRLFQNRFLLGFLGDAARYLEPRPDNVGRRQAIREAGVELLDALHDSGSYSRIIVVGHSLGSVIAYDILSFAWIRRGRRNACKTLMKSREMVHVEDVLNPRDDQPEEPRAKEIAARQYGAWREYRRNGFEWLVSDFVTLGSPLASAGLLLNLDKNNKFEQLVADRSFPTCPPQTETVRSPVPERTRQQFTFTHAYRDPRGHKRKASVQVPHHAGLFALVRWTNLYFPMHGLLGGDPIAGELRPILGDWIQDVALPSPGGGIFGFAHNLYWRRRGDWTHIRLLIRALALDFPRPLEDLSAELDAAGIGLYSPYEAPE